MILTVVIFCARKFFMQRTSFIKTNQSLKVSGVKIQNSLPTSIRNRTLTSSYKTSTYILKLHYLQS